MQRGRRMDGEKESGREGVYRKRDTTPLEAPLSQKHDSAAQLVVVHYEDVTT